MSNTEFINTITPDTDEALLNQFICRKVTEYKDNIIKTIGAFAFYYCADMVEIDLPNLITSGECSFGNCLKLERINIPKVDSIGDSAFEYDNMLSEISLPNARIIGYNAFRNCKILKKVDLIMCNNIQGNAFISCEVFDTLIIRRTDKVCTLSNITAFSGTKIANKDNGYIYVPSSMVDQYKAANNWANFADLFRAIEDYPEICDPENA